jgi:hypothetical protein
MAFDLQHLLTNAATTDELLGPNYEPQIGQKDNTVDLHRKLTHLEG